MFIIIGLLMRIRSLVIMVVFRRLKRILSGIICSFVLGNKFIFDIERVLKKNYGYLEFK